ncbi:MAG: hypothetical protein H7257_02720 [Taibaiella sp.]|nr:hypothetical protein [Taibaiella sp.]
MRSLIAKILMLCTVIIITVHNSIPHDHDHIVLSAHHDHEEGEDDDDHDLFSNNFLAHSFAQNTADYSFKKHIVADQPVAVLVNIPAAINSGLLVIKVSFSTQHEYPPPLRQHSSFGFCGPPCFI